MQRFKILSASTDEYLQIKALLTELCRLFWIEADGEIEASYPCGVVTLKPAGNGRIKRVSSRKCRDGEANDEVCGLVFNRVDCIQGASTLNLTLGKDSYLIHLGNVPDEMQIF